MIENKYIELIILFYLFCFIFKLLKFKEQRLYKTIFRQGNVAQ